jgi:hypothetical protein
MAKVIVSINGIDIGVQPSELGFERYNLTKSGRVLSGDMTAELIAKKAKWTFVYEVMNGVQIEKLFDAVDSSMFFFPLTFLENGVQKTVTVYPGAVKYRKFRHDGVWYWKNVAFDLIQK